jgi:hypothetical protein
MNHLALVLALLPLVACGDKDDTAETTGCEAPPTARPVYVCQLPSDYQPWGAEGDTMGTAWQDSTPVVEVGEGMSALGCVDPDDFNGYADALLDEADIRWFRTEAVNLSHTHTWMVPGAPAQPFAVDDVVTTEFRYWMESAANERWGWVDYVAQDESLDILLWIAHASSVDELEPPGSWSVDLAEPEYSCSEGCDQTWYRVEITFGGREPLTLGAGETGSLGDYTVFHGGTRVGACDDDSPGDTWIAAIRTSGT